MEPFLVRLLTGVLIIWLVQVTVSALGLKEPAARIINIVTIVLAIIWIIFGRMLGGL